MEQAAIGADEDGARRGLAQVHAVGGLVDDPDVARRQDGAVEPGARHRVREREHRAHIGQVLREQLEGAGDEPALRVSGLAVEQHEAPELDPKRAVNSWQVGRQRGLVARVREDAGADQLARLKPPLSVQADA